MCPDCNAEQRFVEIKPNVYVLQLFHDGTCPQLNRHVHR